ncbi:putative plastid-lipid-associated protein [Helianthus debilis subsp. tardiflorus]
MASLLIHSSISPCPQPSFSKQNTLCNFKYQHNLPNRRRSRRSPRISISAVAEQATESDPSPSVPGFEFLTGDKVKLLKFKLLSAVSGLNRGLVASEEDLRKADSVAKEIEAAGGPVDLSADIEKLQGRWKLIYSSAFSSRTLGGSRPGPPIGRLLPITLGQVFQRIDILSKDFDNIVELELGAPWPLQPIDVTATLAHKFEIIGTSTIKIVFEKTTVKTTGNLSQLPPLEIPQLPEQFRPSTNRGNGDFDVTYLDSDLRITRGDRGSINAFVLRVFNCLIMWFLAHPVNATRICG